MILREIVHAHIPTLRLTSTLRDAVDKMDIYQFPALVVTDEQMDVLGVLTEGDICRHVQQQDGLSCMAELPVSSLMTAHPTVSSGDREIGDALHQMLESGLTILPVVDEGRLLGVVLRVDIMQAILADAADGAQDS